MLNKAIIFATKAHQGQKRKVDQSPFIMHPLAVGSLLADEGEREEVVIAGILHDTVEDTDITMEDIEENFGKVVASIVAGCTENKDLSWEDRKQATILDLKTAKEEVCLVTCADKLHNLKVSLHGIKKEGEEFFRHFKRGYENQKWYYASIKNILEKRIPNHPLFIAYKNIYLEAFES